MAMAMEVLSIAQAFSHIPIVNRYAEAAHQVLEANGVDEASNPLPAKDERKH